MKEHFFKSMIIVFFVLCGKVNAQTQSFAELLNITENIELHLSTTTLISGEKLNYTFYLYDNSTQKLGNISKVGYVEILNSNKKSIIKQKVRLKNGIGNGMIIIPADLETGVYKLVAYSKWLLNAPIDKLYQQEVFIINPFVNLDSQFIANDSLSAKKDSISIKKQKTSNKNLNVKVYSPREIASIDVSHLPEGNYSVSVIKEDNLPKPNLTKNTLSSTKISNLKYIPDYRGELVQGKVINNSNPGDVAGKVVAVSSPNNENFVARLTFTNNNGEFSFFQRNYNELSRYYFQVFEENNDYTISLNAYAPDYSTLNIKNHFQLTENNSSDIELRAIALQIENSYYEKKQAQDTTKRNIQPFYAPATKVYNLDEYKRFNTVAETIIEIIPEAYFTIKEKQIILHTRDYGNDLTEESYGSSLVLLDGFFVNNHNKLFEIDANILDRVEIINNGYIFGNKVYDGIISFITKNNDFTNFLSYENITELELENTYGENNFYLPNYKNPTTLDRIPDYRYQLYWNPHINNRSKISFYTSDIKGNFSIHIKGVTDSGEFISNFSSLIVK